MGKPQPTPSAPTSPTPKDSDLAAALFYEIKAHHPELSDETIQELIEAI